MENTDALKLYEGLKALSESAFPKRCPTCGKVFENIKDFIEQSEIVGGKSGLKGSVDEGRLIVELFRNCTCGSTLLDFFSDRRDTSERGQKRRAVFEKLLNLLESRQVPRETGRAELLKVMRGQKSELLESMGIVLRKT